ncbi:hypothetical protein BJX64DRAFT_13924 [Aspergillus heterothallicus]
MTKLNELISAHIRTYPSISGNTTRLLQFKNTPDDQYASRIIDSVTVCYNSALMVFMENIAALAIDNCLLLPLETTFTGKMVCQMTDDQIPGFFFFEPISVETDRQALRSEIDILKFCLQVCRQYNKPTSLLRYQPSKWISELLCQRQC